MWEWGRQLWAWLLRLTEAHHPWAGGGPFLIVGALGNLDSFPSRWSLKIADEQHY